VVAAQRYLPATVVVPSPNPAATSPLLLAPAVAVFNPCVSGIWVSQPNPVSQVVVFVVCFLVAHPSDLVAFAVDSVVSLVVWPLMLLVAKLVKLLAEPFVLWDVQLMTACPASIAKTRNVVAMPLQQQLETTADLLEHEIARSSGHGIFNLSPPAKPPLQRPLVALVAVVLLDPLAQLRQLLALHLSPPLQLPSLPALQR
jgi:hypothetical protein